MAINKQYTNSLTQPRLSAIPLRQQRERMRLQMQGFLDSTKNALDVDTYTPEQAGVAIAKRLATLPWARHTGFAKEFFDCQSEDAFRSCVHDLELWLQKVNTLGSFEMLPDTDSVAEIHAHSIVITEDTSASLEPEIECELEPFLIEEDALVELEDDPEEVQKEPDSDNTSHSNHDDENRYKFLSQKDVDSLLEAVDNSLGLFAEEEEASKQSSGAAVRRIHKATQLCRKSIDQNILKAEFEDALLYVDQLERLGNSTESCTLRRKIRKRKSEYRQCVKKTKQHLRNLQLDYADFTIQQIKAICPESQALTWLEKQLHLEHTKQIKTRKLLRIRQAEEARARREEEKIASWFGWGSIGILGFVFVAWFVASHFWLTIGLVMAVAAIFLIALALD